MKQVLSKDFAIINNDLVINHPSTIFTNDDIPVFPMDDLSLSTKEALSSSLSRNLLKPSKPTNYPDSDLPETTFCFIFDSARHEIISNNSRGGGFPEGGWQEVFNTLNVKFGLSSSSSTFTQPTDLNVEQRLALAADGVEMMTHIVAQDYNLLLNDEDADAFVKNDLEIQNAAGIFPKNANYLGGKSTPAFRSAARKYYRSAATISGNANNPENNRPLNTYNLVRYAVDGGNYNYWTTLVDDAIANRRIQIFFGHAYTDHWYATKKDDDGVDSEAGDYTWQKIVRLIQYIQAKETYGQPGGINIRLVNDALDIHENIIDIGDIGGRGELSGLNEAFRVSKFGEVYSPQIEKLKLITVSGKSALGTIGSENSSVAVGLLAGVGNTGINQVAVGKNAGNSNQSPYVTAIGDFAGNNNSGSTLTAVGYSAGANNTGLNSVFVGYTSGSGNTGTRIIAIGYDSGSGNTGSGGIFIGYQAGKSNTEIAVLLIEHRQYSDNPILKGYFQSGAIIIGAPASAVSDAAMGASRVSFYLDEAGNKLKFKVKYADGTTIKTGEVAIA